MKNLNYLFGALVFSLALGVTSCKDEEVIIDDTSTLSINLSGLEDLGADYAYEGWIIVDGSPVTAGIFNVDADGTPDVTTFELDADQLARATAYVLTIEPAQDSDPAPSKVHILAGDFSGNATDLTPNHPAAINTDFTASTGAYLLGTPTDGSLDSDETSGIWWEDLSTGAPLPSLDLPTLPEGWEYEGWVVINGQPLSTGKFLKVDEADFATPYSGASPGPAYPGEDFLQNAPAGLTFPLDLSGSTAVISVEPTPDNSPAPFSLKPLVHTIPDNAAFHTGYDMVNNAANTNPSGTVTRN